MYTKSHEPAKLVHNKHNTRRYGHPSSGVPGLSGRGYADFHADANFAINCPKSSGDPKLGLRRHPKPWPVLVPNSGQIHLEHCSYFRTVFSSEVPGRKEGF